MTTPLRVAGVAVAAIGLLVACTSSEPSGDVGNGRAPGDAIEVAIADSAFEPDVLRATRGQELTVEITNDDSIAHDFAIEGLGLNTGTIEPGRSAYVNLTVPEETLDFVCTYHEGMDGRIVPKARGR